MKSGLTLACVLALAAMITLTTPAGKYIGKAVLSAAQGLFNTNEADIDLVGIIMPSSDDKNQITKTSDSITDGDVVFLERNAIKKNKTL